MADDRQGEKPGLVPTPDDPKYRREGTDVK